MTEEESMPPRTKPEAADVARAECQVNVYIADPAGGPHITWGPGSVLEEGQISAVAWAALIEDGRLVLTDKPAGRVDPADGAQLAPVEG
jgi:hypothetical protein